METDGFAFAPDQYRMRSVSTGVALRWSPTVACQGREMPCGLQNIRPPYPPLSGDFATMELCYARPPLPAARKRALFLINSANVVIPMPSDFRAVRKCGRL